MTLASLARRALFALTLLAAPAQAQTLDKVSFGTNWVAEAEHGGFYQAVADGTYTKYGLDVTIVPGGPQVNNRILLLAGQDRFLHERELAAELQRGRAEHPDGRGRSHVPEGPAGAARASGQQREIRGPEEADAARLRRRAAELFQMDAGRVRLRAGESEALHLQSRAVPVDKQSAMQGYVTSEPFAIEKEGKFKPKIFLLADHGFNTYSTLIETRREVVEKKPGLVQRFVDASAIGWYNYLYGDNKAANELIRKHNPEMSQELIDYSIARMKEFGIVDSGDTVKLGIGAMTDARMASFFDKMVKAGVVKPASTSASPTRCSSSTRAWAWS